MQLIISNIHKRSGVSERVHCHKFRRTQATHLLNSGMSLPGVQKILGHESPETTQRYARLSDENLKNEYIEKIKTCRLQDKTIKELSEIFNCSVGLIHKILK